MRIWAPGKNSRGPGLALSRAFGDKAARKYGVITQPDIRSFQLNYEQEYIVVGSDGLYDFMKDQEILYFIRKCAKDQSIRREDIAFRLAEQARRISGPDSDDISCIVIFL